MEKPLTVKQLAELCEKEIAKGHGDFTILIYGDDGGTTSYLWGSFITAKEDAEMCKIDKIDGLDEDIASMDKTIILG